MRFGEGVKVSLTPQEQAEVARACQRLNCSVPSFLRQVLCYVATSAPREAPTPAGWPTALGRTLVQVRLPSEAASRLRATHQEVCPRPGLGVYCGVWVMAVLRAPERLDAALKATPVLVTPSMALMMSNPQDGGCDGP